MNFIKYLLLILVALLLTISCKQENKNNYVFNDLDITKEDSIKTITKADSLLTQALSLNNNQKNRFYSYELLKKLYSLDHFSECSKYDSLINQLLSKALKANDDAIVSRVYKIKSMRSYYSSQLDSAYHYLVKAEQGFTFLKDSIELGKTAIAKAQILFEYGVYTESEKEILTGLKLLKTSNEKRILYRANHLLAINLTELFEFEQARKYFDNTRVLIQELLEDKTISQKQAEYFLANLNNNLSHLYYYENDYKNAKKFALKGIYESPTLSKDSQLYTILLTNLIKAKIELNEYKDTNKIIEEIIAIETSKNKKGPYSGGLPSTLLVKAKYYLHKNDLENAIFYGTQAYKRATYEKKYQPAKEALSFLAKYDHENTLSHIQHFMELNDSLIKLNRHSKNTFARIEYEVESLSNQNKKLIADKRIILIIGGLLILIFIGTIISLIQYIKNKNLLFQHKNKLNDEKIYKLILEQKELSENAKFSERKRIAKELHDGVINRIFTTRFHLMQINCNSEESQRLMLINELHKAEEEIRTISYLLNQEKLSDQSRFDQLVDDLISNQQNAFNTKFYYKADENLKWDRLNSEQKLNLYRILQEILQNINKHSQATEVIITIVKLMVGKFQLIIKDNGIGYDVNKVKNKGLGLKNIIERTKRLGASISTTTKPNEGVKIILELDIYNKHKKRANR
ncbi:sensor histidine kinase [Myroides pelagicus]|uniref:histidine kinase n=1 Tax=Myroides pelagicus TaxID=270914 RepID=A0A7K1GKF0_9FLAO|nr:ATP-binding protein [Myroides pelagicus]MTH28999.1 hypothetical protein [Myroides pelagicus]